MSSKEASQYPVSQQIEKTIRNSGYTPLGFLLATGHSDSDTESVLPHLESWLQKGQGDESIIALFAAYDPDQAAALYKALAETVAMQAAGIDPVAHEKERIEKIKRDRFKPYIFAQGERTVPTQITMFGISGGHRRWHTVLIPAAILELPIDEQLARVPELMAKYSQENNGACPFFGRIVGFKFVRYGDYFQFDADGQLLKHVVTQKPFEFGEAWVELR